MLGTCRGAVTAGFFLIVSGQMGFWCSAAKSCAGVFLLNETTFCDGRGVVCIAAKVEILSRIKQSRFCRICPNLKNASVRFSN